LGIFQFLFISYGKISSSFSLSRSLSNDGIGIGESILFDDGDDGDVDGDNVDGDNVDGAADE